MIFRFFLELFDFLNIFEGHKNSILPLKTAEKHDQKMKQKMTYAIAEEMRYLFDKYKHIDICLGIKDGQHSNILREYLGGRIKAETLITVDKIFNIFSDYDSMVTENFIWPKERKRLDSLAPFLELEHKKLMVILQGIWL